MQIGFSINHKIMKKYKYFILAFAICSLMSAMLSSCRSSKGIVETVLHDSIFYTHTLKDSVFIKDSVVIQEFVKGDTIFVSKIKFLTKYNERIKNDTVYISKTDTVKEVGVKECSSKGSSFWTRVIPALIIFNIAFVIIYMIYRLGE